MLFIYVIFLCFYRTGPVFNEFKFSRSTKALELGRNHHWTIYCTPLLKENWSRPRIMSWRLSAPFKFNFWLFLYPMRSLFWYHSLWVSKAERNSYFLVGADYEPSAMNRLIAVIKKFIFRLLV